MAAVAGGGGGAGGGGAGGGGAGGGGGNGGGNNPHGYMSGLECLQKQLQEKKVRLFKTNMHSRTYFQFYGNFAGRDRCPQ